MQVTQISNQLKQGSSSAWTNKNKVDYWRRSKESIPGSSETQTANRPIKDQVSKAKEGRDISIYNKFQQTQPIRTFKSKKQNSAIKPGNLATTSLVTIMHQFQRRLPKVLTNRYHIVFFINLL